MVTTEKKVWHQRLREIAENLGVSFAVSLIVSGIVSGLIGSYFESKLENSKERVAILVETQQKFDESHNMLVARVGVFANEIWAQHKNVDREKILETIITAQSQLLELKQELGEKDDPQISAYATDLVQLQNELNAVSTPDDLRPVYASVIRLLDDHEKIADEVSKAAKVKPA